MDKVLDLVENYLKLFPEEEDRQKEIIRFIKENTDIINWNNFDGHLVAGGFIYARKERKFLLLYHKDLKMFLYPGGHVDKNDLNILETAKREIQEETGLLDFKLIRISNNELIPIDIDTHVIDYNEKLNLPEHYHFEFRYLFEIDEIKEINFDIEEIKEFKWISIEDLKSDKNFEMITRKIEKVLMEEI